MSVPDQRTVIARTYDGGLYDLTTKEGAGKFTEAAAIDLHAVDANFGHLRKPAGRTHVVDAQGNRHAVDVVLYKATGQIVDIIRGAGDPDANLVWQPGAEHEYGPEDWYAPVAIVPPVPTVPPQPPVPDTSHLALAEALRGVYQRLDDLQHRFDLLILSLEEQVTPPAVAFPDYKADGKIEAGRFFGTLPFSVVLKPVVK